MCTNLHKKPFSLNSTIKLAVVAVHVTLNENVIHKASIVTTQIKLRMSEIAMCACEDSYKRMATHSPKGGAMQSKESEREKVFVSSVNSLPASKPSADCRVKLFE